MSRLGLPGSLVDSPGQPGLAEFLHWPVFYLTRTGLATGSQAYPFLIGLKGWKDDSLMPTLF